MKMNKANILIVEDEFIIAENLAATIEEAGYNVSGVAENVDDALELLQNKKIDLILLDINLNQPVDGVQIAHIVNTDFRLPFIFVTAFVDQATIERVKHTKPYGYVTKPYTDLDIRIAVDLAISKFKSELKRNVESVQIEEPIFIKTDKGLRKITVSEIRWIEAYDYYCFVKLKDEKVLVTTTLKDLESKINHKLFVRIHRKYCININHIDKLVGGEVEIGEQLLPIGRTHKVDLLDKINLI